MEEIAPGVHVETGYEGVNVAAVVTDRGLICIDTPSHARDARHWSAQLDRLHPRPPRFLVLTDFRPERSLNAGWLGAPIIAHQSAAERVAGQERRWQPSHFEPAAFRTPGDDKDVGGLLERPAVCFSETVILADGARQLEVRHMPGPTAASCWAYLPAEGVLFAGDSVNWGTPLPLAEMCCGAWIESLQRLTAGEPDVQALIPGRGAIASPEAAGPPLAFLEALRAAVQSHLAAALPRDQLGQLFAALAAELRPAAETADWWQRQVRFGLERAYDELALGELQTAGL